MSKKNKLKLYIVYERDSEEVFTNEHGLTIFTSIDAAKRCAEENVSLEGDFVIAEIKPLMISKTRLDWESVKDDYT